MGHPLSETHGRVHLTFHQTRHTYATKCADAGMPILMLAEQLGHKDTKMLEEVYYQDNAKKRVEMVNNFAPTYGSNAKPKVARISSKWGRKSDSNL